MLPAYEYIPANAPLCHIIDDGFIYFKVCSCHKPKAFSTEEAYNGQIVRCKFISH